MSKAHLFVRGMKEPIELEEQEAIAAQKLIGSSQPDNTPFSIEGVWTGKKADMKFVMFPKTEKKTTYKRDITPMNKEQVEAFEKDIQKDKERAMEVYGKTKKYLSGEVVSMDFKWREFFLERMGAIRIEVTETVDKKPFTTWYMKDAQKFDEASDKIESYWEALRIRDFVEGKKVEGYEKMAEEVEALKDHLTTEKDAGF